MGNFISEADVKNKYDLVDVFNSDDNIDEVYDAWDFDF